MSNPLLSGNPTPEQRRHTQKMSDARKLRLLARVFDYEQFVNGRWNGHEGCTDVQDDLRRIADKIESLDEFISRVTAVA